MENARIFTHLFDCQTEESVDRLVNTIPELMSKANWKAIGGTESNFSIIENQQSNPIAALVEKVTNSMDAILMRKCLESGIDPRSLEAPRSMDEAISKFFPNQKDWDLSKFRREQSENIQVVADGPTKNTSIIIYDDGEGQHPKDFEDTFLSLMRGNKNEIQFVQGKYNMGGSGAIVFCGKKGYQLIGSRKYTNDGLFGFTLVREHELDVEESKTKKNTWYEYLLIDGKIAAFTITELDLNLHNRIFKTGTVIKLFSYQFPPGYSGFAQELNQSFNEFLFEPVLPVLTVDKKERYPNNKVLEQDLFGLRRRLENEDKYIEDYFSELYMDSLFGEMKVTCYVFRPKQDGKTVKETKEDIKRRYFKNNMSVVFCMNGQVHGSFSSEFITRTLKFNLLKDYLLIHVDCTKMDYAFRKELFMASRDRLKQGDETTQLRNFLGKKLQKSQLDQINRHRKETIGLESEDTNELIKSFAKNLPKDSDLFKLIQNTLKLDDKRDQQGVSDRGKGHKKENSMPFTAHRFPSKLKFTKAKDNQVSVVTLPLGSEKTLKFETDVENHYFDRTEEPGELKITILDIKRNETTGGDRPGTETEPGTLLNVVKSSPKDGIIKISIEASDSLWVGDEVQMNVSLTGAGDIFEELVWVKIVDPEIPKLPVEKENEQSDNIGLPELHKVTEAQWDIVESQGLEMSRETVVCPVAQGDTLEKIYINMDSAVFLNYRKKLKSEVQIEFAQRKYVTSVYFHSMFLYMIAKKKQFIMTMGAKEEDISVDQYIREVFDSYYSDFLMNFGMEQLMGVLDDQ